MAKSLDEELFVRIAHLPRALQRVVFTGRGENRGEGRCRRHGAEGCGQHEARGGCHGLPRGHGFARPHGEGHRAPFVRERILGILLDSETGLRQKQIAEQFRVNPSTMSELIDKLEGDGYLNRTVDPTDKRATLITLTEKGRARASELEDGRNEYFAQFFTTLTTDEKQELIRLLDKLVGRGE